LVGSTPRAQQIAILIGAFASALALGPILLRLNSVGTVYVPQSTLERATSAESREGQRRSIETFDATLRTDPRLLETREKLEGPQAKDDARSYLVWNKTDAAGGPPGKYLVDESGKAVYLVDPGVNGTHNVRPDGTHVAKFDAPKATLMSYIIKGILNGQLPWSLVLLGVMTAIVLELAGVPSLPFAVGVYLPLSSSTPILVGGLIRWLADRQIYKRHAGARMTAEELEAESNKSPGVLLSSGYIAGGAIAGIVIAFVAGVLGDVQTKIDDWAKANNPLFEGPSADLLSVIPFAILSALLYFVAIRDVKSVPLNGSPSAAPRRRAPSPSPP
jgi:hypothetical protein